MNQNTPKAKPKLLIMKKWSTGCTLTRLLPYLQFLRAGNLQLPMVLLVSLLFSLNAFAQTTITGTVKDAKGKAVEGEEYGFIDKACERLHCCAILGLPF